MQTADVLAILTSEPKGGNVSGKEGTASSKQNGFEALFTLLTNGNSTPNNSLSNSALNGAEDDDMRSLLVNALTKVKQLNQSENPSQKALQELIQGMLTNYSEKGTVQAQDIKSQDTKSPKSLVESEESSEKETDISLSDMEQELISILTVSPSHSPIPPNQLDPASPAYLISSTQPIKNDTVSVLKKLFSPLLDTSQDNKAVKDEQPLSQVLKSVLDLNSFATSTTEDTDSSPLSPLSSLLQEKTIKEQNQDDMLLSSPSEEVDDSAQEPSLLQVKLNDGKTNLSPASDTDGSVEVLSSHKENIQSLIKKEIHDSFSTLKMLHPEKLVVQLKPIELGAVEVTIERRNGEIHVHLKSDNADVQQLLNGITDDIKEEVKTRESNESNGEFRDEQEQKEQKEQQKQKQHANHQRPYLAEYEQDSSFEESIKDILGGNLNGYYRYS